MIRDNFSEPKKKKSKHEYENINPLVGTLSHSIIHIAWWCGLYKRTCAIIILCVKMNIENLPQIYFHIRFKHSTWKTLAVIMKQNIVQSARHAPHFVLSITHMCEHTTNVTYTTTTYQRKKKRKRTKFETNSRHFKFFSKQNKKQVNVI